tara:strand:- start:4417 stop:4851 length:435 start_codon:yes stop_codon:yes gene_type:complete
MSDSMIDVKAFNIRWHSPNNKNPNLRLPKQSKFGGIRPNPKPGENPTRNVGAGQQAEAIVQIPDYVKEQSEEEQRKHILIAIQEHFNIKIKGVPYGFDYEFLDDISISPPIEINKPDMPKWKRSLQRNPNASKKLLPAWWREEE